MSSPIYEQVIHLINQLNRTERQQVVRYIQADPTAPTFTYEDLQAYFERRRAEGASFESLMNKYAKPEGEDDMSDAELDALLHEVATEWEAELDEFFGSD